MTPPPVPSRVAFFGGVYNNYLALESVLKNAIEKASAVYCLGDIGAFGPYPDKSVEILRDSGIPILQGNYDDSVGTRKGDCACGYTDPRDNHFAALSYAYTFRHTSDENKDFLAALPTEIRLTGPRGQRILLAHGSPRQQNEFLWESISNDAFLLRLLDQYHCDILVVTHTGLHWKRHLPGGKLVLNCGAIGRPANDGRKEVWYSVLNMEGAEPDAAFIPVAYDWQRLTEEMRLEKIPAEFIETIETGWWTTCLEIMPGKERASGKH